MKQAKPKTEHLQPFQYKKGQSGNPKGRPEGTYSLKEYAKKVLVNMTAEEKEDFLNGIDKKTVWEMAEGKPKQDIEGNVNVTQKLIAADE